MKICPKCNSSYSDETLSFCLTDGVPLVESEILSDDFNWQEAKTVLDANLTIHQPEPNVTSPNSAAETAPKIQLKSDSFEKTPSPYLYPLLGVLAMVCVAAGIFWWLYVNRDATVNGQTSKDSPPAASRPRQVVPLTDDQQNSIKKEVTELLEAWRKSIEKRDAEANVKFYTNTLETYYKESGIDRNHVRADRQRAIDRYESLLLHIDKLKVTPETPDTASAVFDKSWTFKNPVKTSTGSVQQEMFFIKQNGKWLINGERDAKVHFINNRENAAETNTNQ
jgi:hypothetical protein